MNPEEDLEEISKYLGAIALTGIPVYRSAWVTSKTLRGHWKIGFLMKNYYPMLPGFRQHSRPLSSLVVSAFGWRVLNASEDERRHLLAEAAIRDALHDEKNLWGPLEDSMRAFGVDL